MARVSAFRRSLELLAFFLTLYHSYRVISAEYGGSFDQVWEGRDTFDEIFAKMMQVCRQNNIF